MLVSRWFRLCSLCSRVVYSSRGRGAGWGTRTGHANITQVQHCWGTAAPRRLCHRGFGDLYQTESVQRYLEQLMEEYRDLSKKLQHAYLSESDRKVLMKKQTALLPLANVFERVEQAMKDLEEVHSLLHSDICQQFTREMFDMYQGFAYYKNWDFEVLNYTPAEYGGLHHAAVRIAGENVYRHLKHDGGTHRVQRIPEVGLSSRMQRIHTGTMTVIILPQPVEFEVNIDPKDLRIDTFRSRGPGGQSVNTTDSAVRIVHLPTGITAECQQTRSQLQNRDTAMRVLRARLYQSMMGRETEQRHTARKQQVGTRSQSERIRTYNFSQDRVTDHRTGYTTRDIKEFMRGGEALQDLISDVLEHAEREALLELVESSCSLKPLESGQSAD
ncbi:peptide chain release factor 1, mitochondrial isoform X2 [Epinephelus moara]|uniref:peptide chain release factor 1, mitochondrial isoform X2 n=1 Tax=Epinephelus moara TaxID=300413 RepID=UPI00214E2970|nr:peptide chain release factor 1, mitochondrial isoform X2 [Epinephelus moara]